MLKPNSQISYITLGVTDLNNMQAFYSALGFELHSQSDAADHPFAMFKSGTLMLALYPRQLLAKQAGCSIDDTHQNAAMSVSLNVETKEAVESYLTLAESLNAEVTKKGFEPAWGGYCGYFKDPENNLWEIVWHEKFVFTD